MRKFARLSRLQVEYLHQHLASVSFLARDSQLMHLATLLTLGLLGKSTRFSIRSKGAFGGAEDPSYFLHRR